MKIWTYQNKSVILEIINKGVYYPDFKYTHGGKIRPNSYKYILDLYNNKNKSNYKGLIFGINKYKEDPLILYNEYINAIIDFSANGTYPVDDEGFYVLELDVNEKYSNTLPIDFYNFANLIDSMDIDIDEELIKLDKENLFKPNYKHFYTMPQVHYHKITVDMITNIYPAVYYDFNTHQFEQCSYNLLRYFKTRLKLKNEKGEIK